MKRADLLPPLRTAEPRDRAELLRMRTALLPDEDTHEKEIDAYFAGLLDPAVVVVAERRTAGGLAAFVEVGTRAYAEGCESTPVAYIEAWWVDPDARRTGLGRALMDAAAEWARKAGFLELASDAELDNEVSIAAHTAVGFEEVIRIVCFRRTLDTAAPGSDHAT